MQQFYIAYSIHGSHKFVTANTRVAAEIITDDDGVRRCTIQGMDFIVAQSRRPEYDANKDGIKLHSAELMTKAGQPLRCPKRILAFFNQLAKKGWAVNKEAFVTKHFKKG